MDTFHRHRQADERGLAAMALECALQTPEYRPEALVWKGIEALPQDPKLAFIYLLNAAHAFPLRADTHALLGRSIIAAGHSSLANLYLTSAWQKMPEDPSLRMMLWQARSQSEVPEDLRRIILAHLPDITAANELAFVLRLLAAQTGLPGTIGVVRYLPDAQEIHGWAIDLNNVHTPASLQLEANGQLINMLASAPHPLLTAAGLPATHGGIRIKVPNATPSVQVRFDNGTALLGSPVSAMPTFVAPPATLKVGDKQPVDVLIPVYDGLSETLECINSALEARKLNRTPHRLVVIEDATPVPALRKALKVLAGKGKITLVQNPINLGFIRSMNRAMALSPRQDVVWLNADTRVHGDWLDRLRNVAYSDEAIASVTPFTNNGELMSFPESRFSHPMPSAPEQARLDDLARLTDSPAMEIETGCGFCLYLKREALNSVGYLDEVELLRGYGEETDWCLRARGLGWSHVGAPNVFVAHQGGISFGAEKALRVAHNNAILKRRYPDASSRYDNFCLRDPIRPARQALQRARVAQLAEQLSTPQLKQLHIGNRIAPQAPFSLTWRNKGQHAQATLHASVLPLAFSLDYQLPADNQQLLEDLRSLPVDELIYQNLANCPVELYALAAQLEKPYRIICRDDELLKPDSHCKQEDFARKAQSIQLPWRALRERYAAVLPQANILIGPEPQKLATNDTAPSTLLIADSLSGADIAEQWLELGRRITREKLPLVVLVPGDNPWVKPLLATGAIHALPNAQGLSLADCVLIAGCTAALSLEQNPGASWRAADLAAELGLPLYAVPGPVAREAGALPINTLPISLSRA
ncbi:Glycosyl transferase family protein [Pseudomonas savastanoi pv. glycinea]|nr:glycosyltransferase family 2 protein [Pseudomonas savastanoi]EFW81945.1 glycosyl transferase family protein [Pseudomonas savastanoi pv. glycinea str. B076]EFW86319.1 glycosyl transferase family protein [Pseudomonas savastanoi pv. glycinea str. race 4]KPC27932.1 Glycosyl transferase family protein [Pseudomonas savastanoi pv. glycinea]KPC36092.1 Glycosyl transferase family protein [Pseudomonas savastanoi pv. glycinea]KPC47271.1 Glycosyl transferase family protein [Pseudomonas savastanoi pv. g